MSNTAPDRAHPIDPVFRRAAHFERASDPRPTLTALTLGDAPDWASQVTSVSIIHLDSVGRVRSWNPGAERITGYKAGEIIGSSGDRFYRPQDRERHLPARLMETAIRNGSADDSGWRVRADGSLFWAKVVLTAIRGDDSNLTGFVNITRDLTVEKREEEKRQAFLRAFAHDYLSPITALRGYVDLLQDAAPEHAHLIDRVSTVSDHLVEMMEQLTTHIGGGGADRLDSVALVALAREAGELVLPGDAYQRLKVAGDRRLRAVTNAAMLRRALANLLDNAAKYSDDDIEISIEDLGDERVIRITDSGRGIAPEDLATIFEPFERGRLSDPADGGSGVGLASVKEIIERVSGRIELTSTLGVGTTVSVFLPSA
jgi:PAS domain S-box-containing protein